MCVFTYVCSARTCSSFERWPIHEMIEFGWNSGRVVFQPYNISFMASYNFDFFQARFNEFNLAHLANLMTELCGDENINILHSNKNGKCS